MTVSPHELLLTQHSHAPTHINVATGHEAVDNTPQTLQYPLAQLAQPMTHAVSTVALIINSAARFAETFVTDPEFVLWPQWYSCGALNRISSTRWTTAS